VVNCAAEMKAVSVRLDWRIPVLEGQLFPRGRRFVVPARLERQGSNWTEDAWSLTIECTGPVTDAAEQRAEVSFLMPDAPHEWLTQGSRFALFEGGLLLADGIVE
jgi:hypothetical protein